MKIRKTRAILMICVVNLEPFFKQHKKSNTNMLQAPYVTLLVHWNLRFPRSRVGYACLKHRP